MMDNHLRFAKAINSQFIHLGKTAQYLQQGSSSQTILVIARRPEQLFELGEDQLHGENPQLEFRVSEIKSPSRGDKIRIGEQVYRIESEPRLELHQLVWVTACLPLTS